ncbi:Type VI secretion system protein TssG [uncultured Desulfobacterium sp.]|uniref:Type VI secretion system protein TssG n=1 Tax=uncultured Desulfobacterium sp. TaxID=201089 RepID=A0A445MTU5_9BACT|nr:Type VI secretion system protein TssG [uncultured Desulfobacterium sp.]
MAPQKRQQGPSLKERLFKEFYSFSFFKAVDLLESIYSNKKPLGQTLEPEEEAVRFSVKPGLAFPPSDILSLQEGSEDAPANMAVTFMGAIGPNGVLPQWFNELAIERNRQKDFSLTVFLDLFHHRLITFFYLAWKKHRFPENYIPGAKDRLSRYLLSLSGLGTPGLRGKIKLPEESLAFYSGLISRQVPSAVAIEATVSYLSGATVNVDQFIEQLIPLSPEDQTQLGSANSRLGVDTVCGSFVRDCQSKFRVNLGPMGYDDFLRFLPDGDMLGPIFSLVKYMVGMEYEFETRIHLRRREVPLCELGAEKAPRLGWTTWIKSPQFIHENDPHITFQQSELMRE